MIEEGKIPEGKIMQISLAEFQPGQSCGAHIHKDLYEVFHCQENEADILIDGVPNHIREGETLIVEPNHTHDVLNPTDRLTLFYILGIAC